MLIESSVGIWYVKLLIRWNEKHTMVVYVCKRENMGTLAKVQLDLEEGRRHTT